MAREVPSASHEVPHPTRYVMALAVFGRQLVSTHPARQLTASTVYTARQSSCNVPDFGYASDLAQTCQA